MDPGYAFIAFWNHPAPQPDPDIVHVITPFRLDALSLFLSREDTTVGELLDLIMAELCLPMSYIGRISLTYMGRPVYLHHRTLVQERVPSGAVLLLHCAVHEEASDPG